jgi:dUTP pyrophosphatase
MKVKIGQKYKVVDVNKMWNSAIYNFDGHKVGVLIDGEIVAVELDEFNEISMNNGVGYTHSVSTFDNFYEIFELIPGNSDEVYFVQKHPLLKFEQHGDLIDLQFLGLDKIMKYTSTSTFGSSIEFEDNVLYYKKGDIFRVKLGFSMKLPEGKMAKTYMRSGTRKNFNVRLTNSVGCIDNNFNGTNDEWLAEFEAIDDGRMEIGDRILQFEIVDVQPKWKFVEVEKLEDVDRGGFGNSGVK